MKNSKVNVPSTPKVPVSLAFVKDPAEKLALSRLRTLSLAKELGNVSEACRRGGMDRGSFYTWKRRFQTHGLDGLRDLPPVHHSHPQETPEHVSQAVLELSRRNPAWGSKRLELELKAQGIALSNRTIQRLLNKVGLGTKPQRYLALEEQALQGTELPLEVLKVLEKLNPCFRERHVESAAPGELVCQDTFYVGHFKGIGRVYLHTAVDTFGSYAFAMLATERNGMRAAELFFAHVVPFYEAHQLKLKAMLTDNGTEFCGTEQHPYEQILFAHDLEHRRTQVRRPQTNGFVERFHRTILDEFFRVELRGKVYESLDALEIDLQRWLVYYNVDRPHQGYRNRGNTPYQTVSRFLKDEGQEG